MSEHRRSLAGTAAVRGVGIHTGAETTVTFRPAPSGHGIVFRRTDYTGPATIPATVDYVADVENRTSLRNGEAEVHTVEHVLAAVAAHRLDDLLIELDGPELPIGDGSAAAYFDALTHAGLTDVGGTPVYHRVRAPYVVKEGDALYIVAPRERPRLTVTIEWDHPAIGRQSGSYDIGPDAFAEGLAHARTFGFASDLETLKSKNLIQGASTTNSIVLSESGVTGTELRWPDEFVRHKAADLLGDLALLGGRFVGDVVAFRPNHRGNIALARTIRRTAGMKAPPAIEIQDILGVVPHRYPMLLVDRIIEIEEGKGIVGIKNVTINEPFFQGHFPGHPIMPGVLLVEAMAQVGGMLLMSAFENPEDKVVYFLSIDKVKFRQPVTPGDQVRFELEMLHFRGRNCRMRGVGYVDGSPVVEAEMMARVVDR